MATKKKKRYFLIDYENVNEGGLKGLNCLTENDTVVIFYSEHAKAISLDLIGKIQGAKMQAIAIKNAKKNALDFVLVTYLGYVFGKENPTCYIISKDTDYESAIAYWKSQNRTVHIAENLGQAICQPKQSAAKPKPPAAKPQPSDEPDNQFYNAVKELGISKADKLALWKILKQVQSIKDTAKRKQTVNGAIGKLFQGKNQKKIYAAVKPLIS